MKVKKEIINKFVDNCIEKYKNKEYENKETKYSKEYDGLQQEAFCKLTANKEIEFEKELYQIWVNNRFYLYLNNEQFEQIKTKLIIKNKSHIEKVIFFKNINENTAMYKTKNKYSFSIVEKRKLVNISYYLDTHHLLYY